MLPLLPRWTIPPLALLIASSLLSIAASGQDDDRKVEVVVVDPNDQPVHDATVDLIRVNREKFERMEPLTKTDREGKVEWTIPPNDHWYYLRVTKEGYAPLMVSTRHNRPEGRNVRLKLQPTVDSWLEIRDPSGNPIVGAELVRLEFFNSAGAEEYYTKTSAPQLDLPWSKSDEKGRLPLPPLPAGCKATISLIHPDWLPKELDRIEIRSGLLSTVTFDPGIRVQVNFSTYNTPPVPDQTMVEVILSTDEKEGTRISHPLEVADGQIHFTVTKSVYSGLGFRTGAFHFSPWLHNYPGLPNPALDLRDRDSAIFQIEALPKVTAVGRVVDAGGKPMKEVGVWARMIDESADWDNPQMTRAERDALVKFYAGYVTTDEDGRFETKVAKGKALIEFSRTGYYSDPASLTAMVSGDGKTELGTIRLLPIPDLRGNVVDSEGKPLSGMICKTVSSSSGSALAFGLSDDHGGFQLQSQEIPDYVYKAGLDFTVFVMAYDPKSARGGIAEVDLRDHQATKNIRVTLRDVEPDWSLAPLGDQEKKNATIAASRGVSGQMPPAIRAGTWLQTEHRSLEAFRGRFVLLDFWFIGCGPCFGEMPAINLAHQVFDKEKFAILGVHTNSSTPEEVAAFCRENGMDYAMVVDDQEGTILRDYETLGIKSFPSYVLIDPEGKIVFNDRLLRDGDMLNLRQNKLEMVHSELLRWNWDRK